MAHELVVSHALIIRGHGAGLSRQCCEPRALIGRILFRCAQPRTRDLFSNPSAPRIARALASDPCERVLAPPDRTHPVGVGFDIFANDQRHGVEHRP
jgi:hypothetical protein